MKPKSPLSEKEKASKRQHYAVNKELYSLRYKSYCARNREQLRQIRRRYYAANKEKFSSKYKIWIENNRAVKRALNAKDRAAKRQATPKWLTNTQKADIRNLYIEADKIWRLSEIPQVIDHIIPLQGKHVCGLHVPWNLQILTAQENGSKGNKYEE